MVEEGGEGGDGAVDDAGAESRDHWAAVQVAHDDRGVVGRAEEDECAPCFVSKVGALLSVEPG